MKKFRVICICAVLVGFMAGQAVAQISYCKDFLEPGNPGGWSASAKTFDDEWVLGEGETTVDMDIWINDVPEPQLLTGGCILVYDPAFVQITSLIPYDNANGGPWDSGLTTNLEAQPGVWVLAMGNLACVSADAGGDLIMGKVTFEYQGSGDAEVTLLPIPDFDTVTGCSPSGTVYDSQITPNTVTISQEGGVTTTTSSVPTTTSSVPTTTSTSIPTTTTTQPTTTTTIAGPECGNDIIEEGEDCDGTDLDGQTCLSLGFDGGTLVCGDDCLFDTTGCFVCGDGNIDPGEECDGNNLDGETCESLGFVGGDLICGDNCLFDTTGCISPANCGNGVIEEGEDCEGEDLNGETCEGLGFDGGTLVCGDNCLFDTVGCFSCGDGVIDPGEECDGDDFGGETCEGLGFDGGTLTCGSDCTIDTSGCFFTTTTTTMPTTTTTMPTTTTTMPTTTTSMPTTTTSMQPTTTTTIPGAECGNGIIENGEDCDPPGGCCAEGCTYEPEGTPCPDDEFCNGEETCDDMGICEPGTPVDCDDGVDCTDDICDDDLNSCVHNPNDDKCKDDGLYCNGEELCDQVSGCYSSGDPCPTGTECNEDTGTCDSVDGIMVYVDIKPGSCPNPLNAMSNGVIHVAVLGTPDFDVMTIDPDTIMLHRQGVAGGVAPSSKYKIKYQDHATPFEGELCNCNDLKGDGYMDLRLKFKTGELVDGLMLNAVKGVTIPLTLTGNLKASQGAIPIVGKDCIEVKGKCKGDFDCDGDVDGKDIHKIKRHFGWNQSESSCDEEGICEGDFDDDGDIDGIDVNAFKTIFGNSHYKQYTCAYLECNGDFDCDRDVDGGDAIKFKLDFGRNAYSGPCGEAGLCPGDFDGDQDCDGTDASKFKIDFGRSLLSNPCRGCVIQ